MAVDATVLDVPDTPANARVFGYPGSRRGNTSRLRLESGQERLLSEIALEQMHLKEFSLISPVIESSHVFKAIETAIPIDVIDVTIGNTEVREERKRKLPSSLVVCA